jgi:hypothetical protein
MHPHPHTPTIVRTNKPMVRSPTIRGGEPLQEKRTDMECPLQPLRLSVGVEQPEAKVLVGINE